MLRFGYNTNGFAHHRLEDALDVLAEVGYSSVALTLDHHALNPFAADYSDQSRRVKELLRRHQLRSVIETGSRFLLDPRRKHQPTLLSADGAGRERRLDFLRRAVDLAADLGADAVSFWSGRADGPEADEALWARLVEGCRALCRHAEARGVRLAFEPEPGMFVDTMPRFAELFARVGHPLFGLTLDVGHLYVSGEVPVAPHVARWREVLWNVHLEDMVRGVHDHRMFGEGDVDFDEALEALRAAGYSGGVHVELSRHSHDAVETARRALAFLRARAEGARVALPPSPL
jgi:sugar phosphate isomerase/epimerase